MRRILILVCSLPPFILSSIPREEKYAYFFFLQKDKFAILLNASAEENKKLLEKGLEVMNKRGEAKCIGMVGTNRWSVEVCLSLFPPSFTTN